MEIRQLRYFVALAEELHFARAAQRVGIEQSPLSRAIKDFEQELGATLFGRTRRRSWLLPTGAALLQHAYKILASVEEAKEALATLALGQSGALRIGASPAVNNSYLMHLLQRYRADFPNVTIGFQRLSLTQQLTSIEHHMLDIGFAVAPGESDAVQATPLWSEPLIVAMPEGHPCSRRRRLTPGALSGEICIAIEDASLQSALAALDLRIARYAADLHSLLLLVASGAGVGLLTADEARRLRQRGIVFRPLASPAWKLTTYLVRSDSRTSPVARRFMEHVLASKTKVPGDLSAKYSS